MQYGKRNCPNVQRAMYFFLAEKCEDSFVHRDCISCCPPTCTFEKDCLGSNLHCLDGCYCPDGKCCQFYVKKICAKLLSSIIIKLSKYTVFKVKA